MFKKISLALISCFLLVSCAGSKKSRDASADLGSESSLAAEFERSAGDRVWFKFNSADISEESATTLMNQAQWLKDHPAVAITVEGHCDERGTKEYNIALGAKRASSVKKALVSNGVEDSRIETISYGKERPAVVGNDEESYKQNRRAVTTLK
jgi:peptidoglycan-associated lipoprotein